MITPLKVLKAAVKVFQEKEANYCLIGGHAASLYRHKERLTKDVDFALCAQPSSASRKLAEQTIRDLGMKPVVGFMSTRGKERAVSMITSMPQPGELTGIIDILIPALPWVETAVDRAQHNKLNLGFAKVPVITPEDLIVAKCFALRNSPDRFQDLDDIKEIFSSVKNLDVDYLGLRLAELELLVPRAVQQFAPKRIR